MIEMTRSEIKRGKNGNSDKEWKERGKKKLKTR